MALIPRIALGAALPVLLSSLGGCGGAQAGGQTGEESDGGCAFTTSPLALDERSALGFSPEQALTLVQGEQRATFEWMRGELSYGPESGAGEVTLSASVSGPARLARIDRSKSDARCVDHVRIPLQVALATAGGAFDESFATTLSATSADEATVTTTVPSADLRGTFEFTPSALGERRFLRLEVNLRFRTADFSGYLFGGVESGGGGDASGTASFQAIPLACWGGDLASLPSCPE